MIDGNFKSLLNEEVQKAADALLHNGDINGVLLNESETAINDEWRKALDDAFEIIADFADRHKIAIG